MLNVLLNILLFNIPETFYIMMIVLLCNKDAFSNNYKKNLKLLIILSILCGFIQKINIGIMTNFINIFIYYILFIF
jgi:hypothetical protein